MSKVFGTLFGKVKPMLAREDGLTLTEILVSMMVFLVVSAGVAGTLTAGLRTAVETRLETMGKAEAQEQMEEMRSRVFYVPYSSDPDVGTTTDTDLLDRYYPDLQTSASTDSQGWQGWYTETADDAYFTKQSPPDDRGIVRTVETRFVDQDGSVLAPTSSYDSDVEGSDTPPSNLVAVSVTTSWTDLKGDSSFTLDSMISSTGQTVQGGGDAQGEEGCESNSNNYADVIGGILNIYTGAAEPYTSYLTGNFGEGHASISTGCEVSMTARATGGTMGLSGMEPYKGADVSVVGPPADEVHVGWTSIGPTSPWPAITIGNTYVEGEVEIEEDEGGELEAEGEANVGLMSVQLGQIDGWPGGSLSGYRRWDFINPAVQVIGGSDEEEDESEHEDDQIEAEIEQEGGETEGEGEVFYEQINILPLQAKTTSTPSALQGLVFIRDFRAEVESEVSGDGASNHVTYSATIGMFNPSKSSSCTGDGCYDLYTTVGPNNPIQTAINLASSNYRLQNALFTEWHSITASEIAAASTVSDDETAAAVSIDAMLKISSKFGTEVRWKTSNPHKDTITLIDQQGEAEVWLGAFDISIFQES